MEVNYQSQGNASNGFQRRLNLLKDDNHALKVKARQSVVEGANRNGHEPIKEVQVVPEPAMVENRPYMSENMKEMRLMLSNYTAETRDSVQNQISLKFQQFCSTLLDKDEVLMALYLSVSRFMNQRTF